jgi:glycosyltransferase involved in cell wall biosynthesis
MGMGGIQRVVNFVKWLHKFGYNIIVLTVKEVKYFAYEEVKFFPDIKVLRTESLDPLRVAKFLLPSSNLFSLKNKIGKMSKFFTPDNKIGWLPFALLTGIKLKFDIILASLPPFSGGVVGYFLKKIKRTPLIIDLRERWPYYSHLTPIHKQLDEMVKSKVLKNADCIIGVSPRIKDELYKINPNIHIIPHGYNPVNFKYTQSPKFTITHVGSLIGGRTVYYLFSAVNKLINTHKIKKEEIKINLIGFCPEEEKKLATTFKLNEVVSFFDYLPHKESMNYLSSSTILWLVQSKEENNIFPGKIGEYIGTLKPILATVPKGEVSFFLTHTKIGKVVSPDDIEGIAHLLYDFYSKFKSHTLSTPSPSIAVSFKWENLVKKLSLIINTLK